MDLVSSVETNEYDPDSCRPNIAQMSFLPISPSFFCPCVNTRLYFILLIFCKVVLEENSHTENFSFGSNSRDRQAHEPRLS